MHYRGQSVACFRTPEGVLTVLAVGEAELRALLKGLSPIEGAKVYITDTDPY